MCNGTQCSWFVEVYSYLGCSRKKVSFQFPVRDCHSRMYMVHYELYPPRVFLRQQLEREYDQTIGPFWKTKLMLRVQLEV